MWLVAFWIATLVLLLFSAIYRAEIDEENEHKKITDNRCVVFILYAVIVIISMDIGSRVALLCRMYITPHERIANATELYETTHSILECATWRIPEMSADWSELKKCVNTSSLYYLKPSSLRGSQLSNPIAFVIPIFDSSSIFVTPIFSSMSIVDKALTILHECSHTALHREDYAYMWENKYNTLTKYQHTQNADSLVGLIKNECLLY